MSENRISLKELQECTYEELHQAAQDRGLLDTTPEVLRRLEAPFIPTRKCRPPQTFEELWPEYQSRFSSVDISKVNLLYNTKCRGLILRNILSEHGYTLAEELRVPPGIDRKTKSGKQSARRAVNIEEFRAGERERKKRQRDKESGIAGNQAAPAELTQTPDVVTIGPTNEQRANSVAPPPGSGPSQAPFVSSDITRRDHSEGTSGTDNDSSNMTEGSHTTLAPSAPVPGTNRYQFIKSRKRRKVKTNTSVCTAGQPQAVDAPPNSSASNESSQGHVSDEVDGGDNEADGGGDEEESESDSSSEEEYDEDDDEYFLGGKPDANCSGHKHDSYGVMRQHVRRRYCPPGEIRNASAMMADKILNCESLASVIQKLNETPPTLAVDDKILLDRYRELRKDKVGEADIVRELLHLPLDQEFDNWDTPAKLQGKVSTLLKSEGLLPGYNFHFRHTWVNKSNLQYFTVHFECANSRRHNLSDSVTDSKACVTVIPLACQGHLYARVYPRRKLLVFKHEHKHHHGDACESHMSEEDEKRVIENVEAFFEDESFVRKSKKDAIQILLGRISNVPRYFLEYQYEKLLKQRYCTSASDWLSTKAFYEEHESEYATFVVYQGELMGLVVLWREVIALLPGKSESVAVDSTHGMSYHKCEYFAALATIDRTGILVASMFIARVNEVQSEVSRIAKVHITDGKPLPQCQIAREVDCVSAKRFPETQKAALLSSFFLLLKGTDRKFCVDVSKHGVCREAASPITEQTLPPGKFVLDMASELPDTSEMAHKKYTGLDVSLVTCDKDKSEILAIGFTYPNADISLCLWHGLQSLSRAVPHQKVKRYSLNNWFKDTQFPQLFTLLCPRLFSDPHDKDHCPNKEFKNDIDENYSCIQCFPDVYETWNEPILQNRAGNSENPRNVDSEIRLKYQDLVSMYKMHERAIHFVPQSFPFLNHFGSSACVLCSTPEELHHLILSEMLEFCLSRRLLYIFRYLWSHWYCDFWIKKWTQIYRFAYNVFTTNMICEAFNSVIKSLIGSYRCAIRLDRLAYNMHVLFYPQNMTKLRAVLNAQAGILSRYTAFKTLKLSWVARRWKMLRPMIVHASTNPTESSAQYFIRDRARFLTDPKNFVCGCAGYKMKNIHMCVHLMRCVDSQSYTKDLRSTIKFNLRASVTTPFFYTPSAITTEELDIPNVWPRLKLHPEYLKVLASNFSPNADPVAENNSQITQIDTAHDDPLTDLRSTYKDPNVEIQYELAELFLEFPEIIETFDIPEMDEIEDFPEMEEEDVFCAEDIDHFLADYSYVKRSRISSCGEQNRKSYLTWLTNFHQFTLTALKHEIKAETTHSFSTVNSRKKISGREAAVLRIPQEDRKVMLRKSISCGFLTDKMFNTRACTQDTTLKLVEQYNSFSKQ